MPGAPKGDAAACYRLKSEYLRYGCPTISTHPTWLHPNCVALRTRMRLAQCPSPKTNLRGLGAGANTSASFENWLGDYPSSLQIVLDADGANNSAIGVTTSADQPKVVFVTQGLVDLLGLGEGPSFGTIEDVRRAFALSAKTGLPPVMPSQRIRWKTPLIVGGIAALGVLGVLWARRK